MPHHLTKSCARCGATFSVSYPSELRKRSYCSRVCRYTVIYPWSTVEERLWPLVNKTDACWLWTGRANSESYGVLRVDGRDEYVHRIAWKLAYGDWPECALHKCDTPLCVRVTHLFNGDRTINAADRASKRRTRGKVGVGEANGRAKLTASDVRAIRDRHELGLDTEYTLAASYGVTVQNIHLILTRKSWQHV